MTKVFQDAKDKYVTALIVYGKAADHKLYKEPTFENQVEEDVVRDAFLKGVLVVAVGDVLHRPASVDGTTVDVSGTDYEAARGK